MTQTYKYLHFIKYLHFHRWDVKAYAFQHKAFDNAVLLRDILTPYDIPLAKNEMLNNKWSIIAKINFSGKLFLRDADETKTFKGNVHKVDGDTLIYSKINVRHGCVYYHPKGAVPFGVSSEYPAYKIDQKRVNGDFLVLLLQSRYFKDALSAGTSGISKARVKPNVFLDIQIPLPSLEEQNKIVAAYNTTIVQADNLSQQAGEISNHIEQYWLISLGVTRQNVEKSNSKYRYLQFTNISNLEEWGIDIIHKKQKREIFKYPIYKISTLCQLGSGGTPSRSYPQYYKGMIPWVKTGEVLNGEIYDTEEHITEDAIIHSSAKLYPKGSLIIAMYGQGDTRGRTAKLAIDATTNQACAVLHNINNQIVSTDYLWYYLQGRYNDLRSMASGNNQPNLNAGKINNYEVVVPPLAIQNEIVNHISALRAKQKHLQQQASDLRTQAAQQFEQTIFN